MKVKYLIIGAGPAGLGAAWKLHQINQKDFLVIEKESYVGGLSASFKDEKGFFWDLGGHVLFDNNSQLAKICRKFKNLKKYQRRAAIYLNSKFIPYPFQDNYPVSRLQDPTLRPVNFKQWLYATFGKTQAEVFFIPQNEKSWAYPLTKMSFSWIATRIKIPKDKNKNWGANANFLYPQTGGIGSLWQKIAEKFQDKIRLNCEVIKIDEQKKEIILSDKNKIRYEYLINSMPLDLMVKKIKNKKVLEKAKKLQHNSGLIIGLGIKGKLKTDQHWIYYPQKEIPFFRIVFNSNFSQTKKGFCALTLETSGKKFNYDIKNLNLFDGEIISKFVKKVDYFYPIPTLDRDKNLKIINEYLFKNQIFSIGRFGTWKYEEGNMDDAFKQGMEAVK